MVRFKKESIYINKVGIFSLSLYLTEKVIGCIILTCIFRAESKEDLTSAFVEYQQQKIPSALMEDLSLVTSRLQKDSQILLITVKELHSCAPSFIAELLIPCERLRSSGCALLAVPESRLKN